MKTKCEEMGCAKIYANKKYGVRCVVLRSTSAWWKEGKCQAFTTDKDWLKKVKQQVAEYGGSKEVET